MTVTRTLDKLSPARRGRSVISLDAAAFEHACAQLLTLARKDALPDALVGIRTGGLLVAEAMARSFDGGLPILSVTCRRSSTGTKQRAAMLMTVLSRLPRFIQDRLRVLEHWLLTRTPARTTGEAYAFDTDEIVALTQWFRQAGARPSLLVVDDAVDSGATLMRVLDLLARLAPDGAVIRSAVITVTTPRPVMTSDYALYQGQLCRFPWSRDA